MRSIQAIVASAWNMEVTVLLPLRPNPRYWIVLRKRERERERERERDVDMMAYYDQNATIKNAKLLDIGMSFRLPPGSTCTI